MSQKEAVPFRTFSYPFSFLRWALPTTQGSGFRHRNYQAFLVAPQHVTSIRQESSCVSCGFYWGTNWFTGFATKRLLPLCGAFSGAEFYWFWRCGGVFCHADHGASCGRDVEFPASGGHAVPDWWRIEFVFGQPCGFFG